MNIEGHLDPLRMYRLLLVDCNKLSPARNDSMVGILLEAKVGQAFFGRLSIFFEAGLKVLTVTVIVDSCLLGCFVTTTSLLAQKSFCGRNVLA
jgi:hypothetical protein